MRKTSAISQAAGEAKQAAVKPKRGTRRARAARAALALLVPLFGFTAACFASPAAWLMADVFLIPAYFHCYRRLARPDLSGARSLAPAK